VQDYIGVQDMPLEKELIKKYTNPTTNGTLSMSFDTALN
jgi:hypothetical protein